MLVWTHATNRMLDVLAEALLDQHVLAGLRNCLHADVLFVARVNPLFEIGSLSSADLSRIVKACKRLTQRRVERAGVTRP